MRDSKVKSNKTPNLLREYAELYSTKGDFEKALTFITRAIKIAEEVLGGVKVHKKYISLIKTKCQILVKKRMYNEAIVEISNVDA